MNNVVAVNFKEGGKLYFFKGNELNILDGDLVIVETERGIQLAKVIMSNIKNKELVLDMKSVLRKANEKDIKTFNSNIKDAKRAIVDAKKIAHKYKLNMNFIDASFTLDRAQLLMFFHAEQRIDFRELAKELASIYKTRIELRQIGVRDKAKEISGIGQCGRELCCSSYLTCFPESVSISMVKNQNLTLNPNKINGQCGRLLCCLTYEDDVYSDYRSDMPNIGDEVSTEKGKGTVISLDILKRTYTVSVPDVGKVEVVLKSKCDECGKKCNK